MNEFDSDLRDKFASAALIGFLAMYSDPNASEPDPIYVAEKAYEHADAMMEERKKCG